MKFTASSADLLKALTTAGGAVPTKSTLPILECILFEQVDETCLSLSATDLEVTIVQQVEVQFEGNHTRRIAVPARRLLDTLRALPEVPISFEADDELRIDQVLERGTGNLMITTEPSGAWVEWEDQRLIESTPGLLSDLPAGLVELRVGAPGREPVKVFAEVPKDATGYLARELVVAVEP